MAVRTHIVCLVLAALTMVWAEAASSDDLPADMPARVLACAP
jgi:hypothetical protein